MDVLELNKTMAWLGFAIGEEAYGFLVGKNGWPRNMMFYLQECGCFVMSCRYIIYIYIFTFIYIIYILNVTSYLA